VAATGFLANVITKVSTSITARNLVPVTDPRNARPLTVFIELPRFTSWNNNVATVELVIRVLAAPPGNSDAADYLMTTVESLMQSDMDIIAGAPSIALVGSQEIPAYDLTVRASTQRN
jgi:hypothetical protein